MKRESSEFTEPSEFTSPRTKFPFFGDISGESSAAADEKVQGYMKAITDNTAAINLTTVFIITCDLPFTKFYNIIIQQKNENCHSFLNKLRQ